MNENPQMNDDSLRVLLRAGRSAPALPPGFRESVWRRIERAPTSVETFSIAGWLDGIAARLLRPRLAIAGVAAMLTLGISIGVAQGSHLANDLAKQRYVAAVSPLPPE
jgi:hypothetical protein